MKKIIILLFPLCLFSQTRKIVYVEYKTARYPNPNELKKEIDPQLKKGFENYVNTLESIEYELIANDSVSIFKKKEKLLTDESQSLSNLIGNGVFYNNFSSKEKIKQIETLGEKFNVVYPFSEYKWEITTETKYINGFKCYKAKTHKETFTKLRNKTVITNPEVWFTPEIPLSFGPFGLIGLPGLILEATINGKLYYYATVINLDYQKENLKLERPDKGKFVTESELEDIQLKSIEGN